jgi:hypothetical protein
MIWAIKLCCPRFHRRITFTEFRDGVDGPLNDDHRISLKNLRDKIDFEIVKYSEYRWETRLDCTFGFRSWDSEYADNYSSVSSEQDIPTENEGYQSLTNERTSRNSHPAIQCTICLETFRGSDSLVKLGCHFKHIYHEKCIEDWFRQELKTHHLGPRLGQLELTMHSLMLSDYQNVKCPLCKKSLVNEDFCKAHR